MQALAGAAWRVLRAEFTPLSAAAPGNAARFPSRWRATRRHASRCIERGIERADPMRLASDKRAHSDRHDAKDHLAFAVECVKLAPRHRLEFGHRHLHLEIRRDVV